MNETNIASVRLSGWLCSRQAERLQEILLHQIWMNPLLNVVTVMFEYYHFRTKHIICLQFSSLVFLRLFSFLFCSFWFGKRGRRAAELIQHHLSPSVSSCQSSQLRLMDRTRTEGSICLFNMKPTRGQPVRTAGRLAQRMLGVKRLSTAFHSLGCFSVHCLDVFRNTIFYKWRSGKYLNKPLRKNFQHTDEIKLESL